MSARDANLGRNERSYQGAAMLWLRCPSYSRPRLADKLLPKHWVLILENQVPTGIQPKNLGACDIPGLLLRRSLSA